MMRSRFVHELDRARSISPFVGRSNIAYPQRLYKAVSGRILPQEHSSRPLSLGWSGEIELAIPSPPDWLTGLR